MTQPKAFIANNQHYCIFRSCLAKDHCFDRMLRQLRAGDATPYDEALQDSTVLVDVREKEGLFRFFLFEIKFDRQLAAEQSAEELIAWAEEAVVGHFAGDLPSWAAAVESNRERKLLHVHRLPISVQKIAVPASIAA